LFNGLAKRQCLAAVHHKITASLRYRGGPVPEAIRLIRQIPTHPKHPSS